MPVYELTAIGEGREVYEVSAASVTEAIQLFNDGVLLSPVITEVSGSEVTEVREVST